MIVKEFYKERIDGIKLFRVFSDSNKMIVQNETGNIYSEAVDVENAPYSYSETDIPEDDEITAEQLAEMTNAELSAILAEIGISTDMDKDNMIDLILYKQKGE